MGLETLLALLAAAELLLLGLLTMQSLRSRGLQRRHEELRRELESTQQDLYALCAGANGVAGHLSRIDQQLRRLYERQDQLELRDVLHREYDHAAKLVRGGADLEKVMAQCNLARAEAELLIRLHGGVGGTERRAEQDREREVRAAS